MSEIKEIIKGGHPKGTTFNEEIADKVVSDIVEVVEGKVCNCLRENEFAVDSIGKSILIKELHKIFDQLKA